MRLGLLSSTALLLAGTGLALGQSPVTYYPAGQTVRPAGIIGSSQSVMPVVMSSQAPAAGPATTVYGNGYANGPSAAVGCLNGDCAPTVGCAGCNGGSDCDPCGPPQNTCWGSLEFLLWNIQKAPFPSNTGIPVFGIIAVDNTAPPPNPLVFPVPIGATLSSNLGSGTTQEGGEHAGYRLSAGMWLTSDQVYGIEASYHRIDRRTVTLSGTTGLTLVSPENDGQIVIVTDPGTVQEVEFFVTSGSGTLTTSIANELWGFEINGRSRKCWFGCIAFDWITGFRCEEFREDLLSLQTITVGFAPGATEFPPAEPFQGIPNSSLTISTQDEIRCRSQFYGAQVGGYAEYICSHVFLRGHAKVALGGMRQQIDVVSLTTSSATAGLGGNPPAIGPTLTGGGALSSIADFGHHARSRIASVGEIGTKIGYNFNNNVRAWVGYDFLYLQNVLRPGNLTTGVTTSVTLDVGGTPITIPDVTVPRIQFNEKDVWIQGINFGAEVLF